MGFNVAYANENIPRTNSTNYDEIYEKLQEADFDYIFGIDPHQTDDYTKYMYSPYPLFRTGVDMYFKTKKIPQGYYLLTPREKNGQTYILFKENLKGKYSDEELKKIVKNSLKLVGLEGIEEKYPHELSGGMQKRVSFARAIVTNPTIILYDEPTAGLDPVASTVIEDYIVRLKEETQATSIVVTHQLSTIKNTADKVIMLYDGKLVFEGDYETLIKKDTPYTKQFVEASIEGPMKIGTN